MKYLHFVSTEKFIEPYVKFINTSFNMKSHRFLSFTSTAKNHFEENYDNVFFQKKVFGNWRLLIDMNKSDFIFLHSLFNIKIIILLFFQPWLLKKCYWIVWGGDLYSYKNRNVSIKNKVIELFRRFTIKRFGHIITLVRGDYDLAKKWYLARGEYHHGVYVNPISKKYLDSLPLIEKEKDDPIVIQIGNSADPTNNHIDALNRIQRFKDKNIEVFVPLSYGDQEYAKEVIKEGEKLFGNKFIPLTEFLSPDKYSAYLNNIDISIFNNDRQQGLFNIRALAYLKKKIYIRDDITSFDHLLTEGLQLYKVKDLDEISFNEFVENNRISNKEKVGELFNNDHLKEIWEVIFNNDKK